MRDANSKSDALSPRTDALGYGTVAGRISRDGVTTSNFLFMAVLQHERVDDDGRCRVLVECIASHSHGVHVWLRWCQGQRSEAEGPRDSGDDEVGVLRKIHRGRARRWSIPAVGQGPTWESGQLTQVQSNCDPLCCAAKELGWGENPEPYEEDGAGKRVEELSVRASQEKDEDEEEEKLDLVQMTREMHICLHKESNEIMKWTEANKGNEYNIEMKRY